MADFDRARYAQLLAEVCPQIIDDLEEHDRVLTIAEQLMEKGEAITPEEEKLIALLVFLVEAFESEVQSAEAEEDEEEEHDVVSALPHETLQRLLTARGLDAADVADIFGNPQKTQDALAGKVQISRGQSKQLANFFRVPAKLFQTH